jgi:hypothetical protein
MRLISAIIFLTFSLFSAFSNAANYTWLLSTDGGVPQSSPQLSCEIWANAWKARLGGNKTLTIRLIPTNDPTLVNCGATFVPAPPYGEQVVGVRRSGTTCPPDTTYNPTTYECEGPPVSACEADAGRTFPYSKTGTWPDAFIEVFPISGQLSYGTQQTACSSGCQIETIAPACTVGTDGTYTCRGEALTTGADCLAGTGNSLDSGDPTVTEGATTLPPPVPETIVEQIPCTYGVDAALGGLKCVSTAYVEKEGTTCGLFNGQNVCTTKQPVSNNTVIETTIVDTTNPDGSTTTTKTDKATKTNCVGAKCESKESTTSSNTTKDGNGTTTSSTTTCSGEACIGNSETGGESEGECLVDCDTFGTPDLDEVASFGDSVTNFTDRIAAAPLLANISSIGMNGSGSCSFPSASTMIGEINFNSICTNSGWLDPLFYVFLALWALAAVRVLLSA